MSAAEALSGAYENGVRVVGVDGADLVLEAPAQPPAVVLDALRRHKQEIVALLSRIGDGWSPNDWLAFFDERAAIAEHEGRLSRPDAEMRAYESCLVEWMNQNTPPPTGPDRCAHCDKLLREIGRDALPFLRRGGHVWLHAGCYRGWQARRRAEAVDGLRALGIVDPRVVSRTR